MANQPNVPEMFFNKSCAVGTDKKNRAVLKVSIAPEDLPRFVERVKESAANGNGMNFNIHYWPDQYGHSSFMIAKKRLTKEQAQAEQTARMAAQGHPVAQPAQVNAQVAVAPQAAQVQVQQPVAAPAAAPGGIDFDF